MCLRLSRDLPLRRLHINVSLASSSSSSVPTPLVPMRNHVSLPPIFTPTIRVLISMTVTAAAAAADVTTQSTTAPCATSRGGTLSKPYDEKKTANSESAFHRRRSPSSPFEHANKVHKRRRSVARSKWFASPCVFFCWQQPILS